MKVTVHNVIVDRDFVTKIAKQVWAWEVPVLEAKFGDGKVRTLDTVEIERESVPDTGDELARLIAAHGLDAFEFAYGKGRPAHSALDSEMKKACGVKKKSKPRKKVAAKKPKAVAKPAADDGDGDPLAD